MFSSWYALMQLTHESGSVISLRCRTVLKGGVQSAQEVYLMYAEKLQAYPEACSALANGATANEIVELYRGKVASNQLRLSRLFP